MEEAIGEPEATMKAQCPHLFYSSMNSRTKFFKGRGGGGGGGGGDCNTPNYTLIVL